MTSNVLLGLLMLAFCLPAQTSAQCREEQAWQEAWTSCQTSASPNQARGQHHWLMYDFGYQYPLSSLHVWNSNAPGKLEQGIKQVVLDYSQDGVNWTEWGLIELPKADGDAYYAGSRVAELNLVQARYVLLSVIQNHGDPSCSSIHELSFGLSDFPVPQSENLWLYPNPASEKVTIAFENQIPQKHHLQFVNVLGQPVLQANFYAEIGRQDVEVNISGLAPGIYFLSLLDEEKELIEVKKLIVR
ncbi:MAG: T9SS type A sorting domain-containing protein [Bacteroidota bacterium]